MNGQAGQSNPLEQMDFDGDEVKASVQSIASMLNIPPHPDHRQLLKV